VNVTAKKEGPSDGNAGARTKSGRNALKTDTEYRTKSKSLLTPAEAAVLYAESLGWHVFPAKFKDGKKYSHKSADHSGGMNWGMTKDLDQVRKDFKRWPTCVGVPTGAVNGIIVVEVDTLRGGHKHDGVASMLHLQTENGPLPDTLMAESPSGSVHRYYKHPGGRVGSSASKLAPGIDVKGDGGMVVAPPSVRPDGAAYRWLNWGTPIADAPTWLVDAVLDEARTSSAGVSNAEPPEDDEIAAAAAVIPNDDVDWEQWNRFAMALYAATDGSDEGLEILHEWSRKSQKYDERGTTKKWKLLDTSPPQRIGVGTIFWMADQADPSWREERDQAAVSDAEPVSEEDDTALSFTDEAIALEFARRYEDEVRYVAAWGKWLLWGGAQWQFDETRKIFALARAMCRAVAKIAKKTDAKRILNGRTTMAVLDRVQSDRRIAATVSQWDTDPWLLNTPGGVVDLRTGEIRSARPDDYMTKMTAVAPDKTCATPRWNAFFRKVVPDQEMRRYLMRVTGYSLTGVTIEHALFFLYGEGRNGKSTFVATVAKIFGSYHVAASMDTFTEKKNDSHPTELARLQGARLVTASETEEGKRWNESRIKELTGGEKISARFMRQDFFEFTPQFKLIPSGNNKPGLRSVDLAIRRRIKLLPFEVTISIDEVDPFLVENLEKEWPGILAKMIEGCLQWQQDELDPPKIVTDATEEYLEAEDALGEWIRENFVEDKASWISSSTLYAAWKAWAVENSEFPGSSVRFGKALSKRRGIVPERSATLERGYRGLRWTSGYNPGATVIPIDRGKPPKKT
jgi:putative DNA primase/helicase